MDIKGNKSAVRLALESLFATKKGFLKLLLVIGIIGIGASVPILSKYEWSGFGKDSNKSESVEETIKDGKVISTKKTKTEHFQSAKTLWDWLGLGGTIAIPVMIYIFQAGEQRRAEKRANAEKEAAEKRDQVEKESAAERAKVEREIADANLRELALQAYIDRMAEILIDEDHRLKLLPAKNNSNNVVIIQNNDNSVQDVARVRTITILRRLEGDRERQEHVLDFLRDAGLLEFILKSTNLSRVNLNDINLGCANLSSANLSDAKLCNTLLCNANLDRTFLSGANLENTNLYEANLENAYLFNVNLEKAFIPHANLKNAVLSKANLKNAILNKANLSSATLYFTNLNNANLEDTNLEGADLFDANLQGTNLTNANLTNVKNITVNQIKTAKNWDKARYDAEFRELLGLLPETPLDTAPASQIKLPLNV